MDRWVIRIILTAIMAGTLGCNLGDPNSGYLDFEDHRGLGSIGRVDLDGLYGSCLDACGQDDMRRGQCFCDYDCAWYEDCCPDFVQVCSAGSCQGHCGSFAGDCWCNADCDERGDCCNDFEAHCESNGPAWGGAYDQVEFSTDLTFDELEGQEVAFCTDASTLNLDNAVFLAFYAANQYGHFGYLGPQLEALGFGRPGDGAWWHGCAMDLYAIRDLEKRGRLPDPLTVNHLKEWGPCARKWYRERHLPGRRPASIAAAFERYLIHEVHRDNMIAFYAGGQFNQDQTVFEQESTQAMIALHRELPIVLVAMRGTETRDEQRWQDIWTDLDVRQVEFGSMGQVHRGFRQAFRQVKYLVYGKLDEIASKEGSNVEFWITGHSLGGALATLLAARMVERIERGLNLELGGLYTFGSPRVGDYEFAEEFTRRASALGASMMRFRHGNDAVTRIPIDTYFVFDFKHVGVPVYIDHDGSLDYGGDPWYGFSGSFNDHYMDQYFGKLLDASRNPAYKNFMRCR